jgi:hypothetical protein
MNLLSKTLFTTNRNHNDSYLSNLPRAIQTNFQHSLARKKLFSQISSRRIDKRNNSTPRDDSPRVGRLSEQNFTPASAPEHHRPWPFPSPSTPSRSRLSAFHPKTRRFGPIPPPYAPDSGSNFVAAFPPVAKLEVL